MPLSTMWISVFQTTSLLIASTVLTHHLSSSMFQTVIEDDAFKAWMNTTDQINAPATSATTGQLLTLDPGAVERTNVTNGTALAGSTKPEIQSNTFYSRELPRKIVVHFVLTILEYYWLIYMEKLLPARPRGNPVTAKGKENYAEIDVREHEIISKWIAQGRVRRASLNWCNTFLKWILTLTIWRVIGFTCAYILNGALQLKSIHTIRSEYKHNLFLTFFASFITIAPIAELIAFVVIPAYKQIVFLAGAKLVVDLFVMVVVQVFANWAVKTDLVQATLRNMTEEVTKAKKRQDFFERFEGEL